MKKQKALNRLAAVAAVLLTLCLVFMAPVGAAEIYVGSENDESKTLNAALAVANDGDIIIFRTGNHEGVGPYTQISQDNLVIKGETGAKYIIESIDGSTGPGFAVFGENVVISDLTIIVKNEIVDNPLFANAADNLTIKNCMVEAEKGGLYFIDGAMGDYEITVTDTTFTNSGSDAMYTVYAGTHNAEHTKLLTFTGNTINGKFIAGIDAVNGNYDISNNNFNIEGGYAIGINANNNDAVDGMRKTISGNTFGDGVTSAVCIVPFPSDVVMSEKKFPDISDNQITSDHPLEVSLNTDNGYSFAEIPMLTASNLIYSYVSGNTYGVIGELEAGVIPLVPGVNLPGSTWIGDAENGYTLTFTEDGTYKVMGDINPVKSITVPKERTITLDLNGKVITGIYDNEKKSICSNHQLWRFNN